MTAACVAQASPVAEDSVLDYDTLHGHAEAARTGGIASYPSGLSSRASGLSSYRSGLASPKPTQSPRPGGPACTGSDMNPEAPSVGGQFKVHLPSECSPAPAACLARAACLAGPQAGAGQVGPEPGPCCQPVPGPGPQAAGLPLGSSQPASAASRTQRRRLPCAGSHTSGLSLKGGLGGKPSDLAIKVEGSKRSRKGVQPGSFMDLLVRLSRMLAQPRCSAAWLLQGCAAHRLGGAAGAPRPGPHASAVHRARHRQRLHLRDTPGSTRARVRCLAPRRAASPAPVVTQLAAGWTACTCLWQACSQWQAQALNRRGACRCAALTGRPASPSATAPSPARHVAASGLTPCLPPAQDRTDAHAQPAWLVWEVGALTPASVCRSSERPRPAACLQAGHAGCC